MVMLSTITSSTDHSKKDYKTIQFNALSAINGTTKGSFKEKFYWEILLGGKVLLGRKVLLDWQSFYY